MTSQPEPTAFQVAARRFLELGCSLIPIRLMSKNPDLSRERQYQKRRPTEGEVRDWFAIARNIAVLCGEISGGLLVQDFDSKNAAGELVPGLSLACFRYCYAQREDLLKETPVVETGTGIHVWLRKKGGGKTKNTTLRYKPGALRWLPVDIKGEGGYVVAPPSVHPSGKSYRFLGEFATIREVDEAEVLEFLRRRSEEWPFIEVLLPYWVQGNRQDYTMGLARILMVNRRWKKDRVEEIVTRLCAASGDPDLQQRLSAVRSTFAKPPEETSAKGWLGEELYAKLVALIPKPKGKKEEGEEGANVAVAGYVELPDGRIAEEILTPEGERFLLYDPGSDSWTVVPEVNLETTDAATRSALGMPEHVGGGPVDVLPLSVEHRLRKSLVLPDGAEEYGSTSELLARMEALGLEVFDPVGEMPIFRMWMRGALASWIVDPIFDWSMEKYASIFPVIGPSETGKGRLLTVCRNLFYRPLYFLKTHRVPSMFRALDPWQGALVLDEADVVNSSEAAELVEFLNSRATGVPIPRYSPERDTVRFFYSFGNTVLALRKPYSDDGFNSRAVPHKAQSTSKNDIPLVPSQDWLTRAAALRRQLLLWRLRQIGRIRRHEISIPSRLDIPGVRSFRVREAFLVLKALSGEEAKLVEDIEEIAKELDHRLVVERASSPEGLILNVIYGLLDGEAEIIHEGLAYRLDREVTHEDDGKKVTTVEPVLLRYVSDALGKVFTSSDVARYWRGLGQGTKNQTMVARRRFRGVILVLHPKRLDEEFTKYVVGAEPKARLFPAKPLEKYKSGPTEGEDPVPPK